MDKVKIKITDEDVSLSISGYKTNSLLRNGFCGKDIKNYDLSELSVDMFKKISFDSNTVFSDEQIEKFNPNQILEESKSAGKSLESLHSKGINGKGVKIAVIDTNIQQDHVAFKDSNIDFIVDNELSGEEEAHGLTVLSSLLQVAPGVQVSYYAYNKYNKEREKIILEYIKDIIAKGDIKIISLSSRIQTEKIKKEIETLIDQNCITLIDSREFYKNFTYCFRDIDSNRTEHYIEAFCEPDQISKEEQLQMLFKDYEINGDDLNKNINSLKLKLKSNNIPEHLKSILTTDDTVNILKHVEAYEEDLKDENYQKTEWESRKLKKEKDINGEQIERKNNESVEFTCAGNTFATRNNTYKFFSTCSASYTIPRVAALFAIARQEDPNITYDNFVIKCREASIKIGDRRIISPEQAILKNEQKYSLEKTVRSNQFLDDLKSKTNLLEITQQNRIERKEEKHKDNINDIQKKQSQNDGAR